jgi:uncharacterized membrane protein
MHVSRALLKNTRASLRFHKRFLIFLVALLVVIVTLVMLCSNGVPQTLTAQTYTSDGGDDSGGGSTSGSYTFDTYTDPTPTPTSTPTSTNTPTPSTTFVPFTTPEYGIGGAVIALLACFVAFTLFMVRGKSVRKD